MDIIDLSALFEKKLLVTTKQQKIESIQAICKGRYYRKHNLPNSIKYIQKILMVNNYQCSTNNDDGRTNSCIDESNVINILKNDKLLKNRLYIPPIRHWFDIAVKDFQYGRLPINIKSTTTLTADNTGNIAMCVYALTSTELDMKKSYNNGKMSKVLIQCLKNNEKNYNKKKDYYFVVINKNKHEVIINSLKGISNLTSNINNLPFQIKWNKNKHYYYKPIDECISLIINTIKKPKPSWRETFLNEIRNLN